MLAPVLVVLVLVLALELVPELVELAVVELVLVDTELVEVILDTVRFGTSVGLAHPISSIFKVNEGFDTSHLTHSGQAIGYGTEPSSHKHVRFMHRKPRREHGGSHVAISTKKKK